MCCLRILPPRSSSGALVPSKLHVIVPAPMLLFSPMTSVAEIREVTDLGARASEGLLELDEVADARALAEHAVGP